MTQFALIGIGAGAAAALLFASVTSGSLLSVLLFYVAPLPMLIAGLGWSHWSALIGALCGAVAVAALFGPVFFVGFLASAGLPAWWLSYLAMLARPVAAAGHGRVGELEWYPPGRLVMWAALLAALVILLAIPNFGADADSFRAGMRQALAQLLRLETGEPGAPSTIPGVTNPQRLLDFLVKALPLAGAVLATITNTLNLWLAGRIVRFSGRLARPWPDLAQMSFPRPLVAALGGAAIAAALGGMLGIVGGIVAAALLMAYAILGFAVLHAITRGLGARPFLLGGVYAAVLVIGWPVLALCLLGLIETAIDLRARIARTRGQPPAHP
ncbi:MAG TPA: DUF2232 domain-containing protein [Pseudolabrys sp.]|nr:DUF2232 domain-containing protein [Pseudolabrys sp.]